MRVVDTSGMQAAESHAVARVGETALMRRAGFGIAQALGENARGATIVAFAGPGNNGGDALAACAELASDARCTVYALNTAKSSDARRDAEDRARAAGVTIEEMPETERDAMHAIEHASLIFDGLLGVGARADTTAFAHLIRAMNASAVPVYALDLPTGIDAANGTQSAQGAVHATHTLTIGLPKIGLLLESSRAFVGELTCIDIGISPDDIDASTQRYEVLTQAEFTRLLPTRAHQADKRSSGAPLIIAGSGQFPGAAVLSARGAARAGAGYVTVATPTAATATLRAHLLEQVVVAIDEANPDETVDNLIDLTRHVQAIGLGPGLGLAAATSKIVHGFLSRTKLPVVIDASGFAHITKHLDMLRNRACVLTPHESEFARLSGKGTIAPGTRIERLREFVDRTGITTLLKGNVTLIYDGDTMYLNPTGTNALATAGTGDVLTGMIATLLAQGLKPVDAARVAAYWHGCAGQLAAQRRPIGVLAGDLPELLADAAIMKKFENGAGFTKLF